MGAEVVLLREAAERMRSGVIRFISQHGPATVSELRQELGSSRRVMVPFLEQLDRAGITQRQADRRKLRDQTVYSNTNLLK